MQVLGSCGVGNLTVDRKIKIWRVITVFRKSSWNYNWKSRFETLLLSCCIITDFENSKIWAAGNSIYAWQDWFRVHFYSLEIDDRFSWKFSSVWTSKSSGAEYSEIQGVTTSFRWGTFSENIKPYQFRILISFVQKSVKLIWSTFYA